MRWCARFAGEPCAVGINDVSTNYNSIGVQVMEFMYGADYLSIGGPESTQILAGFAGVSDASRVLDLGSGLGGPALFLADRYGCTVTGLELMQASAATALQRATGRGLTPNAAFVCGDGARMPFRDAAFDVIIGQDAWCHVPDKSALLSECARVLLPGGTVAFTDWLYAGAPEDFADNPVLAAAASPDAASFDDYRRALGASGFDLREAHDVGEQFTRQYRGIVDRLCAAEPELVDRFGERVFRLVVDKNRQVLAGFESGVLGGGRFVAQRG